MNMRASKILLRIFVRNIFLGVSAVGLMLFPPWRLAHAEPPTAGIPARPEQIVLAPLAFEPPDAAGFRRVLPDGTVVYLATLA